MALDRTTDYQLIPTASKVAQDLRTGRISASDIVEMELDRVAKFNPALNAIVTLDADNARRRARLADRDLARGTVWGPLHGVPITIKDSFDTVGLRTVSGYKPFAQRVPTEDAPPVARLREAGAIILGKTNLPTLASGIQTDNPVFGRTNNPWDLSRTPGGSSGGAAAAVAAGLSYLDLGSDIGGSIRIPAHFCGVYGLKTTSGRIEGKGHIASPSRPPIPPGFEALIQLASFGPIARSIEDLQLVLPIIRDPTTPPLEVPPHRTINELHIAWTEDFGATPLDGASKQAMRHLAESLRQCGCRIERCLSTSFDYEQAWWISGICLGAINTLFQPLVKRWARRVISRVLQSIGSRHPLVRGLLTGLRLDHNQVRAALDQRAAVIDQLETFLSGWDAWICPVFPTPAFTHRSRKARIEVDDQPMSQLEANLLHSLIFNLTGHPVVTQPIGFSPEGLPIGIQVVGRRWQEMALLDVAQQIASVTSGYRSPPGY